MVSPNGTNGASSQELTNQLPSVGELERALGQDLQGVYGRLVGCKPKRVTCHFFSNCIGIIIEQPVTLVENLLKQQEDKGLVKQVRRKIDEAMREEIFAVVRSRIGIEASSVLLETSLSEDMTGALVVLVALPNVRNPQNIPKTDFSRRAGNKSRTS